MSIDVNRAALGRMTGARSRRGFTLVELLVVIGIIGLLVSILLPVIGKARAQAQSVACKSLLRQYALASQMYANEYKSVMVDAYMFLDHGRGLLPYFNLKEMGENVGRCPGDATTEGMGRLGEIGNTSDIKYQIVNSEGVNYVARVSIGCNENATSGSLIPGPGGTTSARWIKFTTLRNAGNWDASRTMTFADYQNNRDAGQKLAAIVGPGVVSTTTANDRMGSLVFRHRGAFNAAFMDGHVGEVRIKKRTINDGHELEPGQDWGVHTDGTKYGTYASHKVFYPFGPGPFKGAGYIALGTMEGWDLQ